MSVATTQEKESSDGADLVRGGGLVTPSHMVADLLPGSSPEEGVWRTCGKGIPVPLSTLNDAVKYHRCDAIADVGTWYHRLSAFVGLVRSVSVLWCNACYRW